MALRTLGTASLVACVGAIAACSAAPSATDSTEADLQNAVAPPSWDAPVERPESEAVAEAARQGCKFTKGAMPAATLGRELPVDRDIPIKNIVVLMQENRSFDSYYGHLAKFAGRDDIESAPEDATNPESTAAADSPRHPYQHAPDLCLSDTNHEWYGAHQEYNGGKQDGFYQANHLFAEDGQPAVDPSLLSGERALWWYDERDIPFYYSLASTFGIGDRYFSSVMGPTWPNRDYFYAATSRGKTTNTRPDLSGLDFPAHDTVIFHELQRRKVSWEIYVDGALPAPRIATFLSVSNVFWRYVLAGKVHGMDDFYEAARNGTLPEVSFLDGNIHEDVDGNDEHPPGDIQNGQKLSSDIVHALFKSPQWKDSVLFITYDENGGIYDHVAPPSACAPDDVAPQFETDEDKAFDAANPGTGFEQLGFRVPITVVSPYTKKSYVSHKTYDHTSITRFIETKFKMPSLTARDANADAMLDFFDFENPPFLTPPDLPEATIDQDRRARCQELYPKNGVQNQTR